MAASSPRRRVKRHADNDEQPSHLTSCPSQSSSQWIRSIQNHSFQPKPTAYSPSSLEDDDPLLLQQRQCRDKIRALRQVRERIHFYPLRDKQRAGRDTTCCLSMTISTNMIFSQADAREWQNDGNADKNARQNVGIDALGSLEMLLFVFLTRHELLRVSGVCTAWKALARADLFWEPWLLTSLEKYPMRALLGLERELTCQHDSVPAVLVYMVYQRLQIALAVNAAAGLGFNSRLVDLSQTLDGQTQLGLPSRFSIDRGRGDEAVSSVHLVCVKVNSTAATLETQQDQQVTQIAAGMHRQAQREVQGAPTAGVPNGAIVALGGQQPVAMHAQNGAGAADDEDVYSVVDGLDRVTLSTWLSTKKRVNERTLRSFLRQLLLAVDTLEQSNCEHADISPVNIVVHCQPRNKTMSSYNASTAAGLQVERDESDEEDEVHHASVDTSAVHWSRSKVLQDNCQRSRRRPPLFQLFVSRRNCQPTNGTRGRALDPVFAMDAERNIRGLNGDIAQQHRILAGAEQEIAAAAGGDRGAPAAALRNRLALPHPSMVSSVIRTAMTVWSRGRFADANAFSVLTQLLSFPDSFSSSLRSFLEYAMYLIITRSATASKLLRHNYLQCPEARLDLHSSPYWSKTPTSDVNEYKRKLMAYYGNLPSHVEGLLDENPGTTVSPTVMDELMPRTNLGSQYFSKALEEANLPSKRFVSVVAPPTASSSWVRKLACTQTCTLQRLDLSHARVPMSVLLQELTTLPRLTHLRLPKQILRDENLEHLVAALTYADLLPRLRGLDVVVRQAMDRMEKSYLMQLDMVTFLLRKPGPAAGSLGNAQLNTQSNT